MGLESHVNYVIERDNPDLIRSYWWSDGLNVDDQESAKEIVKTLNNSNEFGRARFDRKKFQIKFGVYRLR